MEAVLWTLTGLLVVAGLLLMGSACRPRRRRLRDRADGERLGVRISNSIEAIRRRKAKLRGEEDELLRRALEARNPVSDKELPPFTLTLAQMRAEADRRERS